MNKNKFCYCSAVKTPLAHMTKNCFASSTHKLESVGNARKKIVENSSKRCETYMSLSNPNEQKRQPESEREREKQKRFK